MRPFWGFVSNTGGLKVRNRLIGVGIMLIAASTFPTILFAQTAETSAKEQAQVPASTPDISGVWMGRELSKTFKGDPLPPLQPSADATYKATQAKDHKDHAGTDPYLSCYPPGVPRILLIPFPFEILQSPSRVLMLFEYDHFVRRIYTDGREHPKDLDATWMGNSIGKWDGDTLVVDTIGFNDKTWLDMLGVPHSEALHVVERIHRVDHDTLQDDIVIDDPKTLTKPWNVQKIFKLRPKWEIMEYICEDNFEKSKTDTAK
jgi:hypothetical protein